MTDFYIKNAKDYIGKEVTVKGWVANERSSGSISFLQIRDGTGLYRQQLLKTHRK